MNNSKENVPSLVYEDPEVVDAYIERSFPFLKQRERLEYFSELVKNGKILDLGCGPGHESYFFADQGFEAIGLDLSQEMIRRAKTLHEGQEKQPQFIVGDMFQLDKYFSENELDAVWAAASLIHIKKESIAKILKNIIFVTKNDGLVYISLKAGEGEAIIEDDKYGKSIKREISFWGKEEFLTETEKINLKLINYQEKETGKKEKLTPWHRFIFKINK